MKKILMAAACFLMICGTTALYAQRQDDKPILFAPDGSEKVVESIELSKSGDYRYRELTKTGQPVVGSVMRQNQVKNVWIPKPQEVAAADAVANSGKFAEAAAAYEKAREQYGQLGWDVYTTYYQALALTKMNDSKKALALLKTLENYDKQTRKNERELVRAYFLLIELYVADGKFDDALKLAEKMTESLNDAVAMEAFMVKGEIYSKKAQKTLSPVDRKMAAVSYFEAALLFPGTKAEPEALFKAWESATANNDSRAATKFSDLLKEKYPKSEWLGKIK